jgi:hypothetical protein
MTLGRRFLLVLFSRLPGVSSRPNVSAAPTRDIVFTFHEASTNLKHALRPRVHIRRPAWLDRHARPAGPQLAILTLLLLVGLAFAVSCWGASIWASAPPGIAGNDLRSEASSFKLNTTSAEVPPRPPAAMPQKELDRQAQEVQLPAAPPAPPPEPVALPEPPAPVPAPRPVVAELPVAVPAPPPEPEVVLPPEPPRLLPPAVLEAPACMSIYVPQRGETPMMRNWKLLALPAVLTAALSATPTVVTAGGQGDADKSVLERLEKMDKSIQDAFKKISDEMLLLKGDALIAKASIQKAQEKIDQLEKDMAQTLREVAKLHLEVDDLRKRAPSVTQALYPPPDKANLDDIRSRLGKIELDLARIASSSRTSLSPPPVLLPAPVGRLRLINDYSEDLLFLVNGRSYRVAPGTTEVLEGVPAGAFTYEVISPTWGLRARNTPVLAAGEMFTISARIP